MSFNLPEITLIASLIVWDFQVHPPRRRVILSAEPVAVAQVAAQVPPRPTPAAAAAVAVVVAVVAVPAVPAAVVVAGQGPAVAAATESAAGRTMKLTTLTTPMDTTPRRIKLVDAICVNNTHNFAAPVSFTPKDTYKVSEVESEKSLIRSKRLFN